MTDLFTHSLISLSSTCGGGVCFAAQVPWVLVPTSTGNKNLDVTETISREDHAECRDDIR